MLSDDEVIALLRAVVRDMAGFDCAKYDKHLSPEPCGSCVSCRARAVLEEEARDA